MKKLMLFFVLFFFSIAVEGKELYVVGLGDSITTGYSAETGYFTEVCTKLNAKCENLAINGMTSKELLESLESKKISIQKADKIFMSIGGNDFLADISQNIMTYISGSSVGTVVDTGNQLLDNIKQIYHIIFSYNSNVDIYVVPLYNPYFQLLEKNKSLLDTFAKIKKQYLDISSQYENVHISAKLSDTLENSSYLNASLTHLDPHPNQEGHHLIANEILKSDKTITKSTPFFNIYIIILGIIIFCFLLFIIIKKLKNKNVYR